MTIYPFVYAIHPTSRRAEPAMLVDPVAPGARTVAVRFCGDPVVYDVEYVGDVEQPDVFVHQDGRLSGVTASQRAAAYCDGVARMFIDRAGG